VKKYLFWSIFRLIKIYIDKEDIDKEDIDKEDIDNLW
jgi:hypothetical protein